LNTTLIILALAPALAFCGYVIHKDRFEKEPKWLMVFSVFIWNLCRFSGWCQQCYGVSNCSMCPAVLSIPDYMLFLVVALSEEFAKFFFLRYILFKRKEFK
jgi:RsiW-degrading membrane proteinase PrsW (M82 family)